MVQWLRRSRHKTQEQAAQAAAQLAQDYRTVFASDAGQNVLADLLARNHAGQSTFNPDALVMAFREGRRRAALELVEMIDRSPDAQHRLLLSGDTEEVFRA